MAPKKPLSQLRRSTATKVTHLPIDRVDREVPPWPLQDPAAPDEQRAWVHVWSLPQAEAWALMRCERIVARYCRLLVRAERGKGDGSGVAYQNECRQLEDRLGLNPKAAFNLNWLFIPPQAEAPISDLDAYRQAVGVDTGKDTDS
jgi:hypothetical protein